MGADGSEKQQAGKDEGERDPNRLKISNYEAMP
jgi:hypothetical protein